MKAVILAAGMGRRLRPITKKIPKGLIKFDGKTLLEYSLDILSKYKINKTIIVIGYHAELIKQRMGDNYNGIKITYVENEKYSETGSMYSLSQTKNLIDEDILLLESDLLYEPKAIGTLLDSKFNDTILIGQLLNSGDDVYICTNEESEIIYLGKKIPEKYIKNIKGALVGISKYSRKFLFKLFEKAEKDYKNNEYNYHYEECVLVTSRLNSPIHAVLCKDLNWIEIDNESDLKRAKEEVYPKIKEGINAAN